MASNLFKAYGQPRPQQNTNVQNILQQFETFKSQFGNQDPKQAVEQLVASGQMTKEQFAQLGQMANSLRGMVN